MRVQTEVPVMWRGEKVQLGFRLDLLIDAALIVELKTVGALAPIHHAQLLSYLRLSNLPIGILINFHALRLRDGIRRVIHDGEWQLP